VAGLKPAALNFYMKLKITFTSIIILFAMETYSQQNFCSDSSYRIKYVFENEGAFLYNNPDTTGRNYFTGATVGGLAVMKTNWGDSICWAKKILMNGFSWNSYFAPNGTLICTGNWGGALINNPELLLCRIDTNGVMLWAKRYRLNSNHQYYKSGSFYTKNLVITNNAIFIVAPYNDLYNIVAKLDLDGNILWSKSFKTTYSGFSGTQTPAFSNGKLYFFGRYPAPDTKNLIIITSLNDGDGSINETFGYKPIADTLIKSVVPEEIRVNSDNSFSITGLIGIDYLGIPSTSNIFFNSLFDPNLNPIRNYYYKNNIPLNIQELYFDLNNQKQKAILTSNIFNQYDKYFITFDKNDEVLRSRKFVLPATYGAIYRNSLRLDDKQNLHFVYQYIQGNKYINEYARISNLAPNSTLGCFGKDTSILTRYSFALTKQPLLWLDTLNNVLASNDVPYTENTAIVTKELVCKIVSLCNNIKINGPAAACVGVPLRYTVSKNNGCLKNLDWIIDTTAASIVKTEGDSAITLSFKKTFTGYIRAALTDCVVKDSFLVKAVLPLMPPLINRKDSLLCPGKTLTLIANTGYTSYLWQNNTAGQQFTVNSTGVYTITALDSCGATRTDSIRVTLADTTLAIPATQTICLYDTAFITLPNDVNNITWQPTGNSLLNNKTLLLYPQQTTIYTINAGRSLNCTTIKTTTVVIKNCPQTIFIPNSFTPNNDTRNDVFKPIISQPLAFYRFAIYNRYGQTIFETSNQQLGWGGTFKGSRQPQGGYIYQCSYRFAGTAVQKNVNGYFLLLR
jgi:gliding motility-associated-like protein